MSCHRVDVKSIGPSYVEVAKRYKNDPKGQKAIAGRIINGSVGYWGEHGMSAHPDLSERDAKAMIDYIMSLNAPQSAPTIIPLTGTYKTEAPKGTSGKGGYLLRVAYSDKGTDKLEALTAEKIIALRNPSLLPEHGDVFKGTQLLTTPGRVFNVMEHEAHIGFQNLDLTGINEIVIGADASDGVDAAGAVIEIRADAPDGKLLGATEKVVHIEVDVGAEFEKRLAAWVKGGKKGPEPNYWWVRDLLKPTFTVPLEDITGLHDVYFVFKNAAEVKKDKYWYR